MERYYRSCYNHRAIQSRLHIGFRERTKHVDGKLKGKKTGLGRIGQFGVRIVKKLSGRRRFPRTRTARKALVETHTADSVGIF